jgi:hypothetical protein
LSSGEKFVFLIASCMSAIYVQREGEKWGPFTTEEFEGKVAEGFFSQDDLVWREGMDNWQPVSTLIAEETAPVLEISDSGYLYESPEAQLTPQVLVLSGGEIPVEGILRAAAQTEKIRRFRPIVGSIVLGVAILCAAFVEVHRPHLTAWAIWAAALVGLIVWWLRLFLQAIRPAATLLVVDLRNGDERILRMEADEACALAAAIDQAVIAANETD